MRTHRFVDEVRIIIGPKFDMLIKLDNDHEDLIFTEELVEHEVGKSHTKSKNMMCISLPVQAKDRRFILDSGSGHDLISARKAERMNLKQRTCDPIMFHTANGSTATQTEAEIELGTFDMTSHAYVLDDTPSVMSLGKRCMEEGYSFVCPLARCLSWLRKMENASIWQSTTTFPMLTLEHTSALHMMPSCIEDQWPTDTYSRWFQWTQWLDDVGRPSRRIYLDGESVSKHWLRIIVVPDMSKAQEKEEKKSNEPAKACGNSWRRGRTTWRRRIWTWNSLRWTSWWWDRLWRWWSWRSWRRRWRWWRWHRDRCCRRWVQGSQKRNAQERS